MQLERYEIRAATLADGDDLYDLSRYLDSVNLPHERTAIDAVLLRSERAFSGTEGDPRRREYVFVLHDLELDRAIGTSIVFGQLGRRDAPYIFFDVKKEERYSQSLDRHFVHSVLSMGYSYNGPTEIGGLVMHPDARRAPERLGQQISYVRFLWIAMHRDYFQNYVLAELLPPLADDGTSHLWEAVGRRFTGLDYREADRLSKTNKEFIRGLFPDGDIYASLLSDDAQAAIGEVGPQTKGVEKLLRRIGFEYVNRVDPFDGGPHFVAPIEKISLLRAAHAVHLGSSDAPEDAPGSLVPHLVGIESDMAPYFRAFSCAIEPSQGGVVALPRAQRDRLQLETGAKLWVLPLRPSRTPPNQGHG